MKKLLIVLVILAATIAGSAREIKKNLTGSFDSIALSSAFNVELIQGSKHSVVITIDDELEPYLRAEIVQGTLRIGMKNDLPRTLKSIIGQRTLKATIVTPDFNELRVAGACSVKAEGDFKAKDIDVELSGASNIKDLNIKANKIDLDASGASNFRNITVDSKECDIELSGASQLNGDFTADIAKFDMSGASSLSVGGNIEKVFYEGSGACNIKAYDLESKRIGVELSGASSARVYVTDSIDAELSGASSLNYRGPETIKMNSRKVSRGCGLNYEGDRKR